MMMFHLELTKKQEGKLSRLTPPYTNDFKKWDEFTQNCERHGAWDSRTVDRGIYGGLDFTAKTLEGAERVQKYVREIL